MSATSAATGTLGGLIQRMEQSVVNELEKDPESDRLYPNRKSREAFGHYVDCDPTGLAQPYLVSASPDMLSTIGLDSAETVTDGFARLFSGDLSEAGLRAIATPYAVSVFGNAIMAPDPFGRGNGYANKQTSSSATTTLPYHGSLP